MDAPLRGRGRDANEVPEDVSSDELFAALAHRHRRLLLQALRTVGTPERVSALTRYVAVETGRSGDVAVYQLQVRMHHTHLPLLEDAGLVRYDHEERAVELTDVGERLAALLE